MKETNIERNLRILETIRQLDPLPTHVYFTRADGVAVDIPLDQAEIKCRTKPDWELEEPNLLSDRDVRAGIELIKNNDLPPIDNAHVADGAEQFPEVPPRPSEIKKPKKPAKKKSKK